MGLFTARRKSARALSDQHPQKESDGSGCFTMLGLVIAFLGCSLFTSLFVLPLWHAIRAANWTEIPCIILESHRGENHGGKNTTYRVEARYEYHFRSGDLELDPAARYESTRYDLSDGDYSSDQEGVDQEVRRLAPQTKSTCRVDPNHPEQSVIYPGFPAYSWGGLFFLLFPLFGIAMMIHGIGNIRRARKEHETAVSPSPIIANHMVEPIELRTVRKPIAQFIFTLLFALFWNGITWAGLFGGVIPQLLRGDLYALFPMLFLSVFAALGLGLIYGLFQQTLQLCNPRLRLTLSPKTVRLGDHLVLKWTCIGNPARVNQIAITLEGRESATHSRGKNEHTDTQTFFRLSLMTLTEPTAIPNGQVAFELPRDSVPTVNAKHHKIEWVITVRGTLSHWPHLSDDYSLTVLPVENTL